MSLGIVAGRKSRVGWVISAALVVAALAAAGCGSSGDTTTHMEAKPTDAAAVGKDNPTQVPLSKDNPTQVPVGQQKKDQGDPPGEHKDNPTQGQAEGDD